jgi:hypothetical protein
MYKWDTILMQFFFYLNKLSVSGTKLEERLVRHAFPQIFSKSPTLKLYFTALH